MAEAVASNQLISAYTVLRQGLFETHNASFANAMITFEDSLDNKPLKLYTKKFDFEKGIPEKIDGPITLIDYENKMPLSEELEYFCNHLDGNKIKLSNGEHALRVTNILVSASKQLINDE